MEENQKKKSRRRIRWWKIGIWIMALIAVVYMIFSWYYNPEETLYCHIEQDVQVTDLPRFECLNMKIISRDLDEVDVEALYELDVDNIICDKSPDVLRVCDTKERYYSEFPLDLFCKENNCTVDGYICVGYMVDIFKPLNRTSDYDRLVNQYKSQFMESGISISLMNKLLEECEAR